MSEVLVILYNFLISSILTFGFALFMQTPKKHILYSSISGGFGWIFYLILTKLGMTMVIATFFSACLVALLGEIFARVKKAPTIVFIIPGMLPLGPGGELYYTMESLISKEYLASVMHGTTTISIAGSISLAIILTTSLMRAVYSKNYKSYYYKVVNKKY